MSQDSDNEYKKQDYIPKKRREEVWDRWIGAHIGVKNCLLCEKNIMKQGACNGWDCGHVISAYNLGNTTTNNLRPICKGCNSSMGKRNMQDYCEIFEKKSPILDTLKGVTIESMTTTSSGKCVICNVNDRYYDSETDTEILYCGVECKSKASEEILDEENLTCKFCGKTMGTKHALKKHLTSAEFCLRLRGLKCEKIVCQYCERKILKEEEDIHACKKKIQVLAKVGPSQGGLAKTGLSQKEEKKIVLSETKPCFPVGKLVLATTKQDFSVGKLSAVPIHNNNVDNKNSSTDVKDKYFYANATPKHSGLFCGDTITLTQSPLETFMEETEEKIKKLESYTKTLEERICFLEGEMVVQQSKNMQNEMILQQKFGLF
jgi:hypothetical protein